MPSRPLSVALASFSLLCAANVRGQATLPTSAFTPPNTPGSVDAPAETIEFAGVTTVGKSTDLVFVDRVKKKSTTVPLGGEAVEGIQALRYEADKQQAVVKINGVQKTLALRKGTGPVNAPSAVAPMPTGFNVPTPEVVKIQPPPPAGATTAPATTTPTANAPAPQAGVLTPAAPGSPETIAKQEQEARMLVSDLLEIGMAQRKAYEEAQRRAQEGGANPASGTATANPAQPGQTVPPTATPPTK